MTKPILGTDPALAIAAPVASPIAKARKAPARPVAQIGKGQLRMISAAAGRTVRSRAPLSETDPFRVNVLPLYYAHRADYLALARRVALELHKRLGRPITVDDVRLVAPPKPPVGSASEGEDWDGRVMGAIFSTAEWQWVGFVRSNRTMCHKRPISSFVPA